MWGRFAGNEREGSRVGLLKAGLLLGVMSLFTPSGFAGDLDLQCQRLKIVAVDLVGPAIGKSCSLELKNKDKTACHVSEGFSRFQKRVLPDGKKALELTRSTNLIESQDLEPLRRSPAIEEIDRLIVQARTISAHPNVCEPHFIYSGDRPVFGLGPVFINGHRIALGRSVFTNFILTEGASAPLIPGSLLSRESLIRNHYFDIVIAHEMAHGLMQDLYGVDEFIRLEEKSVSRDGHFASAITDPQLAWIEGFAEGFEAFLGEKYLSPSDLETPIINAHMEKLSARTEKYMQAKWKLPSYLQSVTIGLAQGISLFSNIDDFLSEFVKSERQRAIRDNHFLKSGRLANILDYYGLSEGGADGESPDAIYSKEGIVAHFIYKVLKAGLHLQMFQVIHERKPKDFYEFVLGFLDKITPIEREAIKFPLIALFSKDGRRATEVHLQNLIELRNRYTGKALQDAEARQMEVYERNLLKAKAPIVVLPPQEGFWVEFKSASALKTKLMGTLDRINLATATDIRIEEFLKTVTVPETGRPISAEIRDDLSKLILDARAKFSPSVDISELYQSIQQQIEKAQRPGSYSQAYGYQLALKQIKRARACFLNRCETPEKSAAH